MRYILLCLSCLPLAAAAQVVPASPPVPVAATAPAAPAAAPAQLFPLSQLINLYISQHAFEHIEWQRDIRLAGSRAAAIETARTMPGRYIGESTFFGSYTYAPASFGSLSGPQKQEILGSPELKAWLEWFGTKTRIVSGVAGAVTPTPVPLEPPGPLPPDFGRYKYTISIEEMLATQPLQLKLQE